MALQRDLSECLHRGWTAESIRDEWLNELPANYQAGLICQQISRAARNYPKRQETSPLTTNFINKVVKSKGIPA